MIALGVVINPKLKVPLLVVAERGRVASRAFATVDDDGEEQDWEDMGEGYYGEDSGSSITGLPRSHTPNRGRRRALHPNAVEVTGQGYGTSLYTALCLGAHQNYEAREEGEKNRYTISKYGPTGDGISSMEGTRSESAEDWWSAARRRKLVSSEEHDETDDGVDVTSDYAYRIEGQEYEGGEITNVNTIDVDVSKRTIVDTYTWESAIKHNLIIASFTVDIEDRTIPGLWRALQRDGIHEAYPRWILGLDVRGFTLDAINLLGIIGQSAGVDEAGDLEPAVPVGAQPGPVGGDPADGPAVPVEQRWGHRGTGSGRAGSGDPGGVRMGRATESAVTDHYARSHFDDLIARASAALSVSGVEPDDVADAMVEDGVDPGDAFLASRAAEIMVQTRSGEYEPNVRKKKWVEQLLTKRDKIEKAIGMPLGTMLGCGHWGCVFESTAPWVVKLSIDPTEGPICVERSPGCCATSSGACRVSRRSRASTGSHRTS